MSAQKRLIILGIFFSTILIVLISALAILSIDDNLDGCYKHFGTIISRSLAIETTELTKDLPQNEIKNALQAHAMTIIENNDDISYIEFRDNKSRIIYSTKNSKAKHTKITVSAPIMNFKNNRHDIAGSVIIGLTGTTMDKVSAMTKISLTIAFLITWLTIGLIIIMHSIIATRELRTLYDGVKKLSSGEFGYKLSSTGASREVRELIRAFNDMSEKLHTYNESSVESLMLERNKFEAILMSIANGVVVCDNTDTVLLINEHAQSMLEVSGKDIVQSDLRKYCDKNGTPVFREKIEEFKNTPIVEMTDKPLEFNVEMPEKVLKTVISPMFLNSGDYVGYIVVLIDVTKDTEIERMRSQFISNVSHELRTPVTVLRSYSDTLYTMGNEFDYETQKEFIGIMNKEVIRLNDMVNDILDFSRYEAGTVSLEKELSSIPALIRECVSRADVLAREKELKFIVMIEPELPDIPINYDSITRAVMNLISNAIKYSPEKEEIKIKVEKIKNELEITVTDKGPGISEENQKKVFNRFFRVETSTHTVKGTGLGLHLVKMAVEKHHSGHVFVSSKLNEGSTFGIRLPIEETEETQRVNIKAGSDGLR